MNQNKLSSRVYIIVKSAIAAAIVPIIFIYIFIAKPDYKLMNAAAHVVLPVAGAVGDIVTWPVRVVIDTARNVRELSALRDENEELRAALDAALTNKNTCDVALLENQRLARELDIASSQSRGAVMADVVHDSGAFHHSTFFINKGTAQGLENGMVVVSTDNILVGIITDVAANYARVRAITDTKTNIAVRVAGSEVYGFLRGGGKTDPTMEFFSDPEFQPTTGIKLVTSNISGVLPGGILVGEMINEKDVSVPHPGKLSRVMVLKFDTANEYK